MSYEDPSSYGKRIERELKDIRTVLIVAVGFAFVLAFTGAIVASFVTPQYTLAALMILLIVAGVLSYVLWTEQRPNISTSWVADVELLYDISAEEFLWPPHADYRPQSLAHQTFKILDEAGNMELRERLKEPLNFEMLQRKTVFAEFMEYATLKWLFENAFFLKAHVRGLKFKIIDLPDMPEELKINYFVTRLGKAQPKGIYSGLIQYRFDIPEDFSIKYSAPTARTDAKGFELTLQGKYCKVTVMCYLGGIGQVASMSVGPAPEIAGFPIDSITQDYFLKRHGSIYRTSLSMVFKLSFGSFSAFFLRAIAGLYLDYVAILANSFLEYFSASQSKKKAGERREAAIYEKVSTIEMSVQDMSSRLRRIEEKLGLEN
jgi:hypothetical protein